MGGGADRGAQDQPVAAEARHRLAVHGQIEIDHVKGRPRLNRNLIEAQERAACGGRFQHAFQHQVLGHAVVAPEHLRKAVANILRTYVGEKTQLAKIAAEYRRLVIPHLSSGPKNRAVAAQHQSDVGLNLANILLLLQVKEHDLSMFAKKWEQALGFFSDLRLLPVAENKEP